MAENADAYEALLWTEVIVGIRELGIPGFRGIQVLRREAGDEVEFVTMMWFDDRSRHYEVRETVSGEES